jgi:CheY-like chemotaxis protein
MLTTLTNRKREAANLAGLQGTETILLVDDDPGLRDSIGELLCLLGYRVLQAADGSQALKTFLAKPREIAAVVSDAVMPGMSGYQLHERLHALQTPPRFLLISATEQATEARRRGIPFLAKPFRTYELAKTLRELLAS